MNKTNNTLMASSYHLIIDNGSQLLYLLSGICCRKKTTKSYNQVKSNHYSYNRLFNEFLLFNLVLICMVFSKSVLVQTSTFNDFNTAAQLVNNFNSIKGSGRVIQSTTGGIVNTGAIHFNAINFESIVLYL